MPKAEFDLELDLKDLACPMPMVRVSQNITKVPVGGVVKAVTSDEGSMEDIPAWAAATGNEIVSADKRGKNYVIYIRRVK
jgi:tRNA 2-thiouridine synthesizing protein A